MREHSLCDRCGLGSPCAEYTHWNRAGDVKQHSDEKVIYCHSIVHICVNLRSIIQSHRKAAKGESERKGVQYLQESFPILREHADSQENP